VAAFIALERFLVEPWTSGCRLRSVGPPASPQREDVSGENGDSPGRSAASASIW
jgi:hypothetical protein